MPQTSFVLHIWPGSESAASIEPECLASLLYLQNTIPGKFSVEYCANPDQSPSGQLPYLTHGLHSEVGLPAIQKFVSKLDDAHNPDSNLTPIEKAQCTARIAHIEAELGDLVAHYLHALRANYYGHTRRILVDQLPIPQRYYLPDRLRESYKPRLVAADLWNVPEVEEDENDRSSAFQKLTKRKRKEQAAERKFKNVYERKKVLEKARATLDIYVKLLGPKRFFFDNENHTGPTSLDIVFAAHILLLNQPLPDPIFHSLLTESYPTLLSHADLVYSSTFPSPDSFPPTVQSSSTPSLLSLIPRPYGVSPIGRTHSLKKPPSPEEKKFALIRWGFLGASVLTLGLYLHWVGFVPFIARAWAIAQARVAEELEDDLEDEGDEDEEDEDDIEEEIEEEIGEEMDEDEI
ncbi:hypothetical protein K474DRAFT_1591051 [Panus rudis PR-1116 ss-1]|nr:hypothetical protein K474DRAFT_1591051 [Panus rudis PR-1116 ss-1]